MTRRETVYAILAEDVVLDEPGTLMAEGLQTDDVWNIEAIDNPERRKPFLVIAWAENPTATASWSRARRRDLLVWAHDDSADYLRIDRILERVKSLLVGTVHRGGVSQVLFQGGSADLYDDGFRTITRNYGFRVIGTD